MLYLVFIIYELVRPLNVLPLLLCLVFIICVDWSALLLHLVLIIYVNLFLSLWVITARSKLPG